MELSYLGKYVLKLLPNWSPEADQEDRSQDSNRENNCSWFVNE